MIALLTAIAVLQTPQSAVLANEPKLEKKVEIRAEADTLADVLAQVSKETGAVLKPSPSLKDDRLILYADLPAREILDRIARHFDWNWQVTNDGEYLLTQTSFQASGEKSAIEDQILMPYLRWQNEAKEALAKVKPATKADSDELAELSSEITKHFDAEEQEHRLGTPAQQQAWVDKYRKLDEQKLALSRRLSPTWRVADEFVSSLTRQQLLQLDSDGRIVAGYQPTRLQLPLSSRTREAVDVLLQSVPKTSIDPSIRDQFQRSEILRNGWLSFNTIDSVGGVFIAVKPYVVPQPDTPVSTFPVQVAVRGKNGNLFGMDYVSKNLPFSTQVKKPDDHTKDQFDDPLPMTDDLKDAGINKFAPKTSIENFLTTDTKEHPAHTLAHFMVELARAAKVSLISDCYDTPAWVQLQNLPVETIRKAISQFAQINRSEFAFDGTWVTLRTKFWQLRRASTVPFEKLLRIRDLLRIDPTSFDNYAEAVQLTNRRQLAAPLLEHMFERSPLRFQTERDMRLQSILRFWGAIPASTKKSLINGQTVRFASLNAEQQNAIRLFVLHLEDRLHSYTLDVYQDYPPEHDEIAWLKENWQLDLYNASPRLDSTEALPSGIPSDAQIGMRVSSTPALLVSNDRGWSLYMSEVNAIGSGYFRPDTTDFVATPTVQDNFTFSIWTGPKSSFGMQVPIIHPVKPDPKMFSQFPEEIRKRVSDAMKKRGGGGQL